ncbi:MAG TPA: hypothetical protein VF344_05400 [Candidatus Limnocylindrales bacterium]
MRIDARLASAIATIALVGAGCASASTSPEGASPAGASPAAASPSAGLPVASGSGGAPPSAAPESSVIVMADGVHGGIGLWRFQAPDKWTIVSATPGATAVGRTADGVVLVAGQRAELRPSADLGLAAATITLKWPATAPTWPVVALDTAPGGKLALAVSDGNAAAYSVASIDGNVTVLRPAPSQSFTPLIAWLDDTRLLVLSTDKDQVSRLAVVDTAAETMTLIRTIGGIDSFAVSGDRMTLVAATEGDIFVAPVSDWVAGAPPAKLSSVGANGVIWGLAVDKNGTQLAMLAGTVSVDGAVTELHEVGYTKRGSAWLPSCNSLAPFTTARGQAWSS